MRPREQNFIITLIPLHVAVAGRRRRRHFGGAASRGPLRRRPPARRGEPAPEEDGGERGDEEVRRGVVNAKCVAHRPAEERNRCEREQRVGDRAAAHASRHKSESLRHGESEKHGALLLTRGRRLARRRRVAGSGAGRRVVGLGGDQDATIEDPCTLR